MSIVRRTTRVAALCAVVVSLCPSYAAAQGRVGEYEFGLGYAHAKGTTSALSPDSPGDSTIGSQGTAWVFVDVNAPLLAIAGISLNVGGGWSYRHAPNEMSWSFGVALARELGESGYVALQYNPFDVQADRISETPWGEDFRTVKGIVRWGPWRGDVARALGEDTLGQEADDLTAVSLRYRILGVRYESWQSGNDDLRRLNIYVAWGQWGG